MGGSMFLQLALEYTESINSKETPTVLTAVERVIQAETKRIIDLEYEKYVDHINQEINEETVPMSAKLFKKHLKKLKSKHTLSI